MELQGKKALVTGASKGIGLAIAEALAAQGVDLMLTARGKTELESVAGNLGKTHGVRAFAYPCDVGDPEQVRKLIAACTDRLGGLQILINNAGIGVFQPVEKMTIDNWQRTIRTNLDGVFYCCHYAIPLLKASSLSFIINISSLAAKNAFPGGAAYNASKFALTGFSEALMQEVRYDGIRVAYVMPGSVATWFGGHPPQESDSWKIAPQDVAEVVVETLRRHPRCLSSRIEMRPAQPPRK